MKKHIINTIGCIAVALAFAGCSHSTKSAATNDKQQQIVISIAGDGTLSVAGQKCPTNELTARLRELAAQKPTAVTIVHPSASASDTQLRTTQLKTVMGACQAAGVNVINITVAK